MNTSMPTTRHLQVSSPSTRMRSAGFRDLKICQSPGAQMQAYRTQRYTTRLYDILAEPRSPSTNLHNRTSRTTRTANQPGTICGLFSTHNKCKQGHCLGNCRGACPCAIPGSGSSTCGASPLACSTVRKQLELLSLDQRTSQATVALTLLRSPVPQVASAWTTALPVPNIPPSPFAFAVSTAAASEPIPPISPSAAAQALSKHMTPEMRQNL